MGGVYALISIGKKKVKQNQQVRSCVLLRD